MIKAELRTRDGIGQRAWLRSVVKTLQGGLSNAGHPLDLDGRFGSGTRGAAMAFQRSRNIDPTGVIDRATWRELEADLPRPDTVVKQLLPGFAGDLDWVHQQEGYRGRPYWPGGVSGVTLDPGVDVGHASAELVETLYQPLLSNRQMSALRLVFGFRGADARDALRSSSVLKSIRISAVQTLVLMPHTAKPYWDGITRRFPALSRKDTPASVQTVLLSLAYNRGILNRHLEKLGAPLHVKDWWLVAEFVGNMQQGHELRGIRIRRRQERMVIEAELNFLAS